jgi:hypothetical protein
MGHGSGDSFGWRTFRLLRGTPHGDEIKNIPSIQAAQGGSSVKAQSESRDRNARLRAGQCGFRPRRAAVGRAAAAQATAWRCAWGNSCRDGRHGGGDCLLYVAAERNGAGHGGTQHQLPGGSAARPSEGRRPRLARRTKLRCRGMRDSNRGRITGSKGAAHLRSSRRTYTPKVTSLLFAAVRGLFAILVNVFDDALEDEQIGASLAG